MSRPDFAHIAPGGAKNLSAASLSDWKEIPRFGADIATLRAMGRDHDLGGRSPAEAPVESEDLFCEAAKRLANAPQLASNLRKNDLVDDHEAMAQAIKGPPGSLREALSGGFVGVFDWLTADWAHSKVSKEMHYEAWQRCSPQLAARLGKKK